MNRADPPGTGEAALSDLGSPGCTAMIRCCSAGVWQRGDQEKSTPIRVVSSEAEIISQAAQSRCRAILGQQSLRAEGDASLLPRLCSPVRRQPRKHQLPRATSSLRCLFRHHGAVCPAVSASDPGEGFFQTGEMMGNSASWYPRRASFSDPVHIS